MRSRCTKQATRACGPRKYRKVGEFAPLHVRAGLDEVEIHASNGDFDDHFIAISNERSLSPVFQETGHFIAVELRRRHIARPGAGARHAATWANSEIGSTGATRKLSRRVGLIVLLNEPMWMTRPSRSRDASASVAPPASRSSLRLLVFNHPGLVRRHPSKQKKAPLK